MSHKTFHTYCDQTVCVDNQIKTEYYQYVMYVSTA